VPIEVDKVARRDAVVVAARRLIAAGGLDAVTFRNLARALDCSTTSISHYFPTMKDVLVATYRETADIAAAKREAAIRDGGRDVLAVLERTLPLGDAQADDWKIWLCFWTAALFDPAMAEEQKVRSRATGEQIARLLLGAGHPARGLRELANAIMTAIYGIAVQAIFDPEEWPAEAQRRALRKTLGQLMERQSPLT
jgi:AcrR family transcriptional regulator